MHFRPHRGSPRRTIATAVAVASVAAFLIPLGTTGSSATADVDAPPTLEPISAGTAKQALEVAEEVMAGESDAVSPTLALRDLALGESALTGDDLEAAETLLARPNEGTSGGDGFAAWNGICRRGHSDRFPRARIGRQLGLLLVQCIHH